VLVCPPHPEASGYGGVGWSESPLTPPPAGAAYGFYPYGGAGGFPDPKIPIDGGFGGDPYGLGPYGSVDKTPPQVASALSISGWEIEVFFTEPMDPLNPALLDPASYTLTPVAGAAPSVTIESVRIETLGEVDSTLGTAGAMSVILKHTGTTQGGTYSIVVVGPTDMSGNPLLDTGPIVLLCRGEAPPYTVTPIDQEMLRLTFAYPMLTAALEPHPGSGIDNPSSYSFTSDPDYPIAIRVSAATHPFEGSAAKVGLTTTGMTRLDYTCIATNSTAVEYDGSVLPSAATGCDGQEQNPQNGSSEVSGGLLRLNRPGPAWGPYGWGFFEPTVPSVAHITPDSTTRMDFTFNAGQGLYSPALDDLPEFTLGEVIFQNGPATQGLGVRVGLKRDAAGTDLLSFTNNAFTVDVLGDWSTGTHTLSLVWNQKAETAALLLDGLPVAVTPFTNLTVTDDAGPGVTWLFLDAPTSVTGFQILGVEATSTYTVFSEAWNFLHNHESEFEGAYADTRDWLQTQRGPLVKGWGDATPATKQDVTVLVNGVEVGVEDVNPYIGRIQLTTPIPFMPPGDIDVKVDYKWFATPTMELAGLNTLGLVLNKWDRGIGHHDPAAHGEQNQDLPDHPKGRPDTARFPMAVVLGPMTRPSPMLIGHRYLGFEREYSALLNSPTTLLLNTNPHQTSTDAFEEAVGGSTVAYEATGSPRAATPPWTLQGTDTGAYNTGQGTWTLIDAQSGSYDPDDAQTAMYWRELDLTFPSAITLNTRFTIPDTSAINPDGVFTGVGFGFHNNHELYLVGALLVNGLQHVGMLIDPRKVQQVGAWEIGPETTATITSTTTMSVPSAEVPTDFKDGDRFQILEGPQAGVHTATHVVAQCDGTSTCTVSPAFPADPTKYGNNYPTAIFETPWNGLSTYRLVADPDQKVATLAMSGTTTSDIVTLDGNVPVLPMPAETSLILTQTGEGQVFWGSLSRMATNTSTWSFVRYGITPDQSYFRSHSKAVATEMGVVPEHDPNFEWYTQQTFGYSKALSNDDDVLLKATSASESLKFLFGYKRIEPFFAPDSNLDLRANFRMDTGTLGAGDTEIVLNDGNREIRLATLLYVKCPGQLCYRRLIDLPVISMAGLLAPLAQDWTEVAGSSGTGASHISDFITSQSVGESLRYTGNLDTAGLCFSEEGDRVLEARFAVDSVTFNGDASGIFIGGDFGQANYYGEIRLIDGGVRLLDANGVTVQDYTFDWDDGEFHTYRLVASQGVVTLFLDDEAVTPTLVDTQFPGGTGNDTCLWGVHDAAGLTASSVRWRSLSYSMLPPPLSYRTLGVWKGGDKSDIDNWEIPRTDATDTKNSAETGPVVEDMDWREWTEVRILRTPTWGVTVFRPDMPLPPYYQPETPGVPGSGFTNETTEPSAGWINLEYPVLPRVPSTFGFVGFGSFDPRSVTQQRWDFVRYRLFKVATVDFMQPQGMVLNRANIINSGERTQDVTYERIAVQTLDKRRLSLRPTQMYASSVYKVIDGTTIYTYMQYTFDEDSQVLTLGRDSDGNDYEFSGETVSVEVIFIPGQATVTYLQNQPLLDGVTLLNEGTPPVPKSQTGDSEWEEVNGTRLNDPDDTLNDPGVALNDPYRILTHRDPEGARYESLDFIEVDNDGSEDLISSICEGTLPQGFSGLDPDCGDDIYTNDGASVGSTGGDPLDGAGASADLQTTGDKVGCPVGAHVLELSGTMLWDKAEFPKQPDFEQGGGMPGHVLFASGGGYLGPVVDGDGNPIGQQPLGGTLGPGTAVLWPNYPSKEGRAGRGEGRIYQRTDWHLQLWSVMSVPAGSVGSVGPGPAVETPLEEDWDWAAVDNTPPSRPHNWTRNPSGPAPSNGMGAAFAEMTGAGDYSHIGPWGGLDTLTPERDHGFFEFLTTDPDALDGVQVRLEDEFVGGGVTLTGRKVPLVSTDFGVMVQPHVQLAEAINRQTSVPTLIAFAGVTLAGRPTVMVESIMPVSTSYLPVITTIMPSLIVLAGVAPDITPPPVGESGVLTGGAGIRQSSLLAGGFSTVVGGVHDPWLGIVCEGGHSLPPGVVSTRIIRAANP